MAISGISQAKVTGVCSNCHTMHNSQNGAAMATYGSSNPEGAGTGTKEFLLRGTCFGCHAQMTSNYIETINDSKIPQVYHNNSTRDLAGGNFAYITGHKGSGASDTKGHNVIQLDNNDDTLATPPGDQHSTGITNANFTCAGQYGCHGNRATTGNYAAMKGAHHTDDGTIDGNSTGTSFRFLKGVLGLEYNTSDYPWQDYDKDHHNEYKGATSPGTSEKTAPAGSTISGLCAECHGYYHGSGTDETGGTASPWLRHPTDIVLKGSGEYTAYTTYSTIAPVARTDPTSVSSTVTPGTDIIMCLSCHGVHATNYFKLMHWDYTNTTLSTALEGCNVCHTSKD